MYKNKIRAKTILLYFTVSLLSGALSGVPAVFDKTFILAWIFPGVTYYLSLVLLEKKARSIYTWLISLAFSAGFLGVSYSFIFSLDKELLPDFIGIPAGFILAAAWLFLSLLQAVIYSFHLPITIFITRRVSEKYKGVIFALLCGALYCVCELLLSVGDYATPWMNMAITQTAFLPAVQIGSLFGSSSVTFIIIFVCATTALALKNIRLSGKNAYAICAAALFILNALFGVCSMYYSERVDENSQKIRVSALQGNISSRDKWGKGLEKTIDVYDRAASFAAGDGARVLIMPETAVPYDITQDSKADRLLSSIASDNKAYLIAGVFKSSDSGKLQNAVVCYDPSGTRLERFYIKRRLVPFGEFVAEDSPLLKIFPFLGELNLVEDSLLAGEESVAFDVGDANISSMICFDSMFSESSAEAVGAGAGVISLSTNDSWFGGTHFLNLHLRHSILRAVESRRYIIRAASTGTSAAITPTGKISAFLEEDEYGFVSANASVRSDKTLFCRIGSPWFFPAAVVVAALLLFFIGAVSDRQKYRNKLSCN